MENDTNWQQIIPYILFSFEDNFFAYKYLSGAGEQRLVNNNYQLGVGGHINKEDVGADFFITQLCFDKYAIIDFCDNVKKAGLTAPLRYNHTIHTF